MKKTMLVWMLLAILTVGTVIPIGAIAEAGIMPRYDYATSIDIGLYISGATAHCSGGVELRVRPSSLSMTLILQKKNGDSWDTYASWSDSAIGEAYLYMDNKSCSVSSGTYRVKVSITVCMPNGDYEYISEYSHEETK